MAPPISAAAKAPARPNETPEQLARNERYWREVAAQYDVTGDVVLLENGFFGVMARPVLTAYEQNVERVNRENSYYARLRSADDQNKVRARIAASLGVSAEEIALTRNATEALQALITGYGRLRPGDAVLFADLDYDAMQDAMRWLTARRGVEVVRIALPEPATYQGIIDAYAAAFEAHPNIRMTLLTHLGHRTGLIAPVQEIIALARHREVDVILDSAHAWGQIDFRLDSLDVDFAGFNVQKWLGAPLGVGFMYIRRSRLADIEPYLGDSSFPADDIRSRVHSGTANFAAFMTVPDALDFHDAIGTPVKEARLRYLRDQWAEAVRDHGAWEILTPTDQRLYAGLTSFRRKGRAGIKENVELAKRLLEETKILTVYRSGVESGACVRATPSMFTSLDDVEQLRKALAGPAARW
ncbi:aminotransferase class V-fold PLP-dependent enzyme [Peristeroidobacter soli]|uniref:aminotransferase class V-fold PLP-dependent enzyme n=1 Tax=Peristeroidobacter soli TaxID=2497877 RepID=UPI001C3784B7|nr:aminotransferase class V-fold PLP-dependent enzyme [Peristeroidobacter soli]